MKRKLAIAILLCLSVIFLITGCKKTEPVLPTGELTWGDDYSFTNIPAVKVDNEVTLDANLDEEFWQNTNALTYTSTGEKLAASYSREGFEDGTITIKTYFSEVGLYVGVVVDDPTLYNTGKVSAKWRESNIELYVSYKGNKDLAKARQLWIGPDDYSCFGQWLWTNSSQTEGSYFTSTARNFGTASKITDTGFVAESVVSWEDLGLTQAPEYVQLYPCWIRVKEVPYKDGNQTYVWHNFAEELGASYGDVKSWLKFKPETGFQEARFAEDISTYDASAFVNYPEVKIQEYNGGRSLAFKAYYDKANGLWVNGVANHNKHVATGAFANCTNFEVQIEGKQSYIFISDGKLKGAGFDEDTSMMWTVENPQGSPSKYTSYLIMFMPNDVLIDLGVSQSLLDLGYFQLLGAFKTAGEDDAIFNEGSTPVAPDWWRTSVMLVGEDGFFDTKGVTKSVQFVDTTTKKSFTYSAVLNKYGLYIKAEAKTDAPTTTLVGVEYTTNIYTASNPGSNRMYIGSAGGNEPTWKNVSTITCKNPSATGYKNRMIYYIFMDYAELKSMGFTYNFNSENPIESTVYIRLSLDLQYYETLEFRYTKPDGTQAIRTSNANYGWCLFDWWFGGFTATEIPNARFAVTKNGMA